jgi:hypothetical protein
MLAKPGTAIVLFPGGAAEALATEQGKYNLVSARSCLLKFEAQT